VTRGKPFPEPYLKGAELVNVDIKDCEFSLAALLGDSAQWPVLWPRMRLGPFVTLADVQVS
jgi:hypothetical protein